MKQKGFNFCQGSWSKSRLSSGQYLLTCYMIFSICGIAFQYITIKQCLERFKEYKTNKNIQITIQEKPREPLEDCLDDFINEDKQMKLNNSIFVIKLFYDSKK